MLKPQTQFGRYLIVRRIGRGGMAEVYEARLQADEQISKRVALKVLREDHKDQQRIIDSFIDEARMAAPLSHPNVVEVFDFGETAGELYMAMEYMDGLDLRQLIELCSRRGRQMPVAAAAFVAYELALALDYIHNVDQPIVHRDVTPHNVFITRDGHVKLGDFGVARSAMRLVQTDSGEIKGKLSYLAPEQLSGDPVDARTDVYAAGLVLFELLTGRRLLEGKSDVEVLRLAMAPPEILPSSINPEAAPLDRLVTSALQRHPAMRLPSAAVLARRLQEVLTRVPFDAVAMAELAEDLRDRDETAIFAGLHADTPGDLTDEDAGASTLTTPFPHQQPEPAAGGTRQLDGQPDVTQPRARRWPWVLAVVVALSVVAGGIWLLLKQQGPVQETPGLDSPRGETEKCRAGACPPPMLRGGRDAKSFSLPVDRGAPDLLLPDRPPPVDMTSPDSTQPDARVAVKPARRAPRRKPRRRPRPRPKPAPAPWPPVKPTPNPAPTPAAGIEERRGRLRKLISAAAARGLFPKDSAAFDARAAAARKQLGGPEGDEALDALERQVTAFAADRRFVERKLARLERAIKQARLSDAARRELSAATRKILKLTMSGRLVEASRLISAQMRALRMRR